MPLTTELRSIAKALVAGTASAIASAIGLGSDGFTQVDFLIVLGAFLAGAFPTWVVPNTTPPRNEAGVSDVGLCLAVCLAVILVLALTGRL